MRAEVRTALRIAIAIAIAAVVVRFVAQQWDAIRISAGALHPSWPGLLGASACVFAGYAVLIASWRIVLRIWCSPLSRTDAARIWFVSSLGKYVPGKIWSIAAMAVLAKEAGASPVAATGSAIIMQLVNLAAGFAVVALAGAGDLLAAYPLIRAGAWVTVALTIVGLLIGPAVLSWSLLAASRVLRQPTPQIPTITRTTVALIFGANVVAWIAYGVGFGIFWRALLGHGGGISLAALAVYTSSYLLGFLALVVPGGLGVRETALTGLLISLRLATPADAALLAAASRIWLTVLEIIPGLAFLPGSSWRRRTPISTPDGPAA